MKLQFVDWGLIDYPKALEKQETYVEQVYRKLMLPTVIFCSHPPLVTKGRATQKDDIFSWSGPIYEINRGGRATYHGPSQILIYPIIPLNEIGKNSKRIPSDVGSFLREFEMAIVDSLKDFGILSKGKSFQPNLRKINKEPITEKEETGVWIEDKKIASLGLSFRHWISFHGAALNVDKDPFAFQGINPCGFSPSVMTSIEEQIKIKCDRGQLQERLKINIKNRL